MILRLEIQRSAKRAKHRPYRDVRTVELIGHGSLHRHPNAPRAALDDQRSVLDPYTVGQTHQERIGRRKDAAVPDVRLDVTPQRPAVE
jgi:hypothetical protein